MNWRLLTWKDVVGFLSVVAIVGVILYVFVDPAGRRHPTNFGFGRTVVADSVNPIGITRDAWMSRDAPAHGRSRSK
jgi:hypothetical protein